LEAIVRGLPPSQALELCATLNLLVANPQDLFFERGDAEVLSRLALYDRSKRKILRYLSRHAGYRVLTRVNLIALMKWVAWLSQELSAHAVPQKDGFLIAAIVASDRFIARHGELWNRSAGPDHYNPARIQLAYQVPFWGSGRGDPVRALGRARRLYLTPGPLGQDSFRQAFEQQRGLTLESFLCFLTFLRGAFISGSTNNAQRRMGENVADSENAIYRVEDLGIRFTPAARTFSARHITEWTRTPREFQREIQHASPHTFEHGYRFKDFVDKPRLRIAQDKFTAVDRDCLARQLTAGPVFKVIPILGAQQAFSIFGKGTETYVEDLLEEHNRLFASSGHHTHFARSPKAQSRQRNNEFTDLRLTYNDTVVCVEVKTVWLKDDDVFNTDPHTFWERIKCSDPRDLDHQLTAVQSVQEGEGHMAYRRQCTPELTAEVVLELLSGAKSSAELCREHQIAASVLADWQAILLERAGALFESSEPRNSQAGTRVAE
jgi:hypothetical protein